MNYDMTALYRKILLDIKDTQRPSGRFAALRRRAAGGTTGAAALHGTVCISTCHIIFIITPAI